MFELRKTFSFLSILGSFVLFGMSLGHAQSYIPIDEGRGIYCGDFPDGTTMIVGLQGDTIVTLLPDSEITRLRKRITVNRRRERTLARLRKNKLRASEIEQFNRVFRQATGRRFRGSATNAIRALSKLRKQLNTENRRLSDTIADIQACEAGELPTPNGGLLDVLNFEFEHPDFGVTYYMFGLALVYKSNPRKIGSVCVSAESGQGTFLRSFPTEVAVTPQSNPCLSFFPTNFRSPPRCSGVNIDGDPRTVIQWLDVAFSVSPPSNSRLAQLERQRERTGLVTSRPKKRKKKCRS